MMNFPGGLEPNTGGPPKKSWLMSVATSFGAGSAVSLCAVLAMPHEALIAGALGLIVFGVMLILDRKAKLD